MGSLRAYRRTDFYHDLIAGTITAILLVPQGIAFAMLAGLPPEAGLYASILPTIVYALLGTSRTLSVGPVSVAAIMVASALSAPALQGQGDPLDNALVLAFESGLILLVLAIFRLGALVNFISHPVLAGFTGGASILIVLSQLPHLLGAQPAASNLGLAAIRAVPSYLAHLNGFTVALGFASVALLYFFNQPLARRLTRLKLSPAALAAATKIGPLVVVMLTTSAVVALALADNRHVAVVGPIPAGLPQPTLAFLRTGTWMTLLPSACFIALVGYVESVAMAKVLANRRRQKIDPNQELVALGVANIGAALSGAMPVAGGFSRTMVNFSAGAVSQIASLVTAIFIALAIIFCAPLFHSIPKAALAAIIIVAIVPLINVRGFLATWHYDRSDGLAFVATFLGVLLLGIEAGLSAGIVLSLLLYLWRSRSPHIAVVGRVAHTEHFRNIRRHQVETWNSLLLVRVDENLSFANVAYVENFLMGELSGRPAVKDLVLIASAINHIDASALEGLENLIASLYAIGITVHLAEVKGPVMDKLNAVNFVSKLSPGRVFLSTIEAVHELTRTQDSIEYAI